MMKEEIVMERVVNKTSFNPSNDILTELLYYMMNSLPAEKRVAIMEGINTESDNYEHNDDEEDYNKGIKDSFYDSFDYIGEAVRELKLG